jgi:hypothetical protein
MINPIESYQESGTRAARALGDGDWPRSKFESDHARRMQWVERTPADRAAARKAFEDAYHAERDRQLETARRLSR